MRARAPHAASPRFPDQRHSDQGKSGPKGPPKGQSRWKNGQDSITPVCLPCDDGEVTPPPRDGMRGLREVGVFPEPRKYRSPSGERTARVSKLPRKVARRKAFGARTVNRHRWAGRASQGVRVNHGQGTRQNDPVTSGEGVLACARRREVARATVYQKHMALRNRKMRHKA